MGQARHWGISVYLGTPEVKERLPGYLELAAHYGASEIFTSLHIPETPFEDALAQVKWLTNLASQHDMHVVADIAPGALKGLGAHPEHLQPIKELGLAGVRLDYGFSPEEIAHFARNDLGLRIQLNTSTIDPEYFAAIMKHEPNKELLESCHNFYPRPETAIAMGMLTDRSRLFNSHGLRVAAFVPSQGERRGPLYCGLPTVEKHRELEAGRAAIELFASGCVDYVLFGDPWALPHELAAVEQAAKAPGVALRVRLTPGLSPFERKLVVGPVHNNRMDATPVVIRSAVSRGYATQGPKIEPFNCAERHRGSVTVDNVGYLRYSGELQITLVDRPADPKINVVAQVLDEDLPLLDYINPGTKFTLIPVGV